MKFKNIISLFIHFVQGSLFTSVASVYTNRLTKRSHMYVELSIVWRSSFFWCEGRVKEKFCYGTQEWCHNNKDKIPAIADKVQEQEDSALGLASRLDLSSGRKSAIGAHLPWNQ